MALYTGLRHPRPLGGILVASGYELLPETLAPEAARREPRTPILFCHGISRRPGAGRAPAARPTKRASREGRPAEWREFPIGHEVSMPEIETIGAWLRERLPAELTRASDRAESSGPRARDGAARPRPRSSAARPCP